MDASISPQDTLPPPFTYTQPAPTLLTQGAEALLYTTHFLFPSQPSILKYRPSKAYRHPTLDKRLTRHRILSEARTLVKCRREGLSVPGVLALDAEGCGHGGWMMMELIEGRTVREALQDGGRRLKEVEVEVERWEEGVRGLMGKIGRAVGRLHEVGVVHGDLTTSNMMLRPIEPDGLDTEERMVNGNHGNNDVSDEQNLAENMDGEIVLIDFGLAAQSLQDEDKAVDLYVLERAFGSTHPEAEAGFQEVLRTYRESYKGAKVVLKRLEDVRMRGRKRSMLG